MLASACLHLGLFALLGGFVFNTASTIPPVAIELLEVPYSVSHPLKNFSTKKSAAVVQHEPDEFLESDTELSSESKPVQVSATPSQIASAKELYISKLFRLLNAKKRYPEISLKMRQQGRLKVRFVLERDGRIASAELVETSNFLPLNEAAKSLLAEIKKFDPLPNEISDQQWAVTVPIEYLM